MLQKQDIDNNKTVYIHSHPQALNEHETYLRSKFSDITFCTEIDTAQAANNMKNNAYKKNSLVIAPKECADIYGLKIHSLQLTSNAGYTTTIYLVKKKVV